jgi:hypothetical protein
VGSMARFVAEKVVVTGITTISGECVLEVLVGAMLVDAGGAEVVPPDAFGQLNPGTSNFEDEVEEARIKVLGKGVGLSGGDGTTAAEFEASVLVCVAGAGALDDALGKTTDVLSIL